MTIPRNGAAAAGTAASTQVDIATMYKFHRTSGVSLSNSLKATIAATFTPTQLRHLAALLEADAPGLRARRSLDEAGVEELAQMIVDGRTPTAGFWRRHAIGREAQVVG